MSLHRVVRRDGSVCWRVRWRDGGRGTPERTRTFDLKGDAEAYEREVRRRQRLGEVGLIVGGRETLNDYVVGTWTPQYATTLRPVTATNYATLYDAHIASDLGSLKLVELTPERIAEWQADLVKRRVGLTSVRKTMTLLGSILQRAYEAGRLARNPVRMVRRVKPPMKAEVRPLAPVTVEAMRSAAEPRDATLIATMAYAGLRPGEALRLTWGHVGKRTLTVLASKTEQRRSVRLLAPLAEDLAAWRTASSATGPDAPIFPNEGGEFWSVEAYKSWARSAPRGRKDRQGRRTGQGGPFGRAAKAAGVTSATPYTLRHSFCSLLLHEGRSVIYVARQLGHDAAQTLSTYGHVIEELEEAPKLPAEEAIRRARRTSCDTGVEETPDEASGSNGEAA